MTTLPLGQCMALLKLRKGELAATILAHLAEMSAPQPSREDWRAVLADGLALRREGRLALTPPGLHHAGEIMRDFAQRLSIEPPLSGAAARPITDLPRAGGPEDGAAGLDARSSPAAPELRSGS